MKYDPSVEHFYTQLTAPPLTAPPLTLSGSFPEDGSSDVSVDTWIGIRMSEPIDVRSATSAHVTLDGGNASIALSVVPAEQGMLVFATPNQVLAFNTRYTVTISGLKTPAGETIADSSFSFSTSLDPNDPNAESDQWTPNATNGPGNWKTNRPHSHWEMLPPLMAAPGVTALSGRVLRLSGLPLANVTLMIGKQMTRTDSTGRFLLTDIPSGHSEFVVDGNSASKPGKVFGMFEIGVNVLAKQTNVLPNTVWLPVIDTAHEVTIPVPTTKDIVITHPNIPGLVVRIPAGTIIRLPDGQPLTTLSITPIPSDRPPIPTPNRWFASFVFQTHGAKVQSVKGIESELEITYPNLYQHSADQVGLYSYDAAGVGWHSFGSADLSADGRQFIPRNGKGINKLACAQFPAPSSGYGDAANGPGWIGDPVDASTGLFIYEKTDLAMSDVIPIVITRTYRQLDSIYRAFGKGTSYQYDLFITNDSNTDGQQYNLWLPNGQMVSFNAPTTNDSIHNNTYYHTGIPAAFDGASLDVSDTRPQDHRVIVHLKDGSQYFFNYNGWLTFIVDRYGNTVSLTRDSNNYRKINKITSPNGRYMNLTWGSSPDGTPRITSITDNISRSVTYAYDTSGRLTSVTDAAGGVWQYAYNSSDQMTSITDPRNTVYLTNQYDPQGHVSLQTQADNSTFQFAYTININNQITRSDVTNPRGFVTETTYDSAGQVLTNTLALNQSLQRTWTYTRDSNERVLSVTDPLNRETTLTYDSLGNIASMTTMAGTTAAATTSFTYEPAANQLETITDAVGHVTTYDYDSQGKLLDVRDPLHAAPAQPNVSYTYNSVGLPLTVTDALGNQTQFGYSGADLTSITDPRLNLSTMFYDGAGRIISRADGLGNISKISYNSLNEVTQLSDPLNGSTSFSYDGNGNLLSLTDAKNHTTTYTYNNMDRVITRMDPLNRSESYQYDANGNLTQFTDRRNQVTTHSYDALDRRSLSSFNVVNGVPESTITYNYETNGARLSSAADSISGTVSHSYDDVNRTMTETTPLGSITYNFDALGRRSAMTVSGQSATNYTYDNGSRLTQIAQGSQTVGFTYDNDNRRATLTLPNGIVATYSFDANSNLTSISYATGSNPIGNLSYGYDALNRRTQIGGSLAQTNFPAAIASATYDVANELINWNGTAFSYDANGNMVSDGVNTFSWNGRNQLMSLNTSVPQYDAFGRRTQNLSGRQFRYDGVNSVQELISGTVAANAITGGMDEVFSRTDSTSTYSPLIDGLGSTLALADWGSKVTAQTAYDPWGQTTSSGTSNSNTFQYTGRENDGNGIYYNRNRYYYAALGRFISEDPLGQSPGVNEYAYVGDNPVLFSDPTGLDKCDPNNKLSLWPHSAGFVVSFDMMAGTGNRKNIILGGGGVANGTAGVMIFPCGQHIVPVFSGGYYGYFTDPDGNVHSISFTDQHGLPGAAGASTPGVSLGVIESNAVSSPQINGPFPTVTAHTPIGSGSLANSPDPDNNTYTVTVTVPSTLVAPSLGVSSQTTQTSAPATITPAWPH